MDERQFLEKLNEVMQSARIDTMPPKPLQNASYSEYKPKPETSYGRLGDDAPLYLYWSVGWCVGGLIICVLEFIRALL